MGWGFNNNFIFWLLNSRSPAAGLKQRQEQEEMEVENETIEVVDAKGRKQVIEAPVMVPAVGEAIEDGGDIELWVSWVHSCIYVYSFWRKMWIPCILS